MQYLTRLNNRSIYLIAIGLFMLAACGKVEIVELAQTKQESFVRASSLTVTGQVLNPETGEPIAGAVVTTASFTATTDAEGYFKASVNSFNDSEAVTVSKEGHIVYEFGVNYTGFSDGSTLNWEIYLPERETCIWIGPDEGEGYEHQDGDFALRTFQTEGDLQQFSVKVKKEGGRSDSYSKCKIKVFGLPFKPLKCHTPDGSVEIQVESLDKLPVYVLHLDNEFTEFVFISG